MKHYVYGLLTLLATGIVLYTVLTFSAQVTQTTEMPLLPYNQTLPEGFRGVNLQRIVDPQASTIMLEPSEQIKQVSNNIVLHACTQDDKKCAMNILTAWTQEKITHTRNPQQTALSWPEQTLLTRGGDDLSQAILLVTLLRAQQINSTVMHTRQSNFVEAEIDGEITWLDPACRTCRTSRVRFSGTESMITRIR